jgi:hypothetical protein
MPDRSFLDWPFLEPRHRRLAEEAEAHRLGVDRLVDAHRPFHLEHALGDAVGVGRPGGEVPRISAAPSRPSPRSASRSSGATDAGSQLSRLAVLPIAHSIWSMRLVTPLA